MVERDATQQLVLEPLALLRGGRRVIRTRPRLAEVVRMEVGGELTATQAKQVLAELVADPSRTAAEVAAAKGFEAMDTSALEAIVDSVIAANPTEWEQFKAGDDKARKKLSGFFTGQIMKASKGQADGRQVALLLAQKSSS